MAKKDYKYMRAWFFIHHVSDRAVQGELKHARKLNAPADAVYWDDDGKQFMRFRDAGKELKKTLNDVIKQGKIR